MPKTSEIYYDNSCRIIYFKNKDINIIHEHIFNSLKKGIQTIFYYKNINNNNSYLEINNNNVSLQIKKIK